MESDLELSTLHSPLSTSKIMLNKISIALIDESGNIVPVNEKPYQVEMKLDSAILDLWTESANRFKSITDEEERFAQKFEFVQIVTNFLRENREDEQPF